MRCSHAAARRTFEETKLQQVWFDHIHDRIRLFADRGTDGIQSHGPAAEFDDDGAEDLAIEIVKTGSLNDDDGTPGVSAGDTIDYTYVVTNTGNVALDTNAGDTVTVTDDQGARDSDDVRITVDPRPDPVSFAAEILPYFGASVANCVLCHSGGTGAAGVNLDSYANIKRGSVNGPVVVPRQPGASELVRRLRGESQPRMPLTGPPYLDDATLARIEGLEAHARAAERRAERPLERTTQQVGLDARHLAEGQDRVTLPVGAGDAHLIEPHLLVQGHAGRLHEAAF